MLKKENKKDQVGDYADVKREHPANVHPVKFQVALRMFP